MESLLNTVRQTFNEKQRIDENIALGVTYALERVDMIMCYLSGCDNAQKVWNDINNEIDNRSIEEGTPEEVEAISSTIEKHRAMNGLPKLHKSL